MSEYAKLSYGERQTELKKLGLSASGNSEALLKRLEDFVPGETPEEEEQEDEVAEEDSVEAVEETEPSKPVSKAKVSDQEIVKGLRTDAQKMKEHLAGQKKIAIMIPLEPGVSPEIGEKIPFIVNMNGYRLSIKRGTYVEVPEQVAQMIMERLQSEGKVGRERRIDRDEDTTAALG
jgi:bifunctional DNA-binding transcriptional regulator/antitoxin component of YhaV-PrlF toxin-antitoxin module